MRRKKVNMMEDEEKLIFELIDQLDLEEADWEPFDLAEDKVPPLTEGDAASILHIKALTISKLQAEKDAASIAPAFRLNRRRRFAFAAAATFLLVAVLVGSSPSVQAELKKVVQFLPGLGTVQESDLGQLTYVLEKPYIQEIGSGKLTIDGIALQPNAATITLRGVQIPEVQEFKAKVNGRTYTFTASMRSSSGDWYGSYNYVPKKGASAPVSDTITLYINDTTVGPIKLVPPKTAVDLEHLGSSALQQDVTVTAFPTRLEEGIIRVQLISELSQSGLTVNSYGVSPLLTNNGLYVEDANGTMAELVMSDALSYPSDFQFYDTLKQMPYTVVVPYIEVSDRNMVSKEVSILLPDVGVARSIDVPAELSGFPIRFTRVTRISETTVNLDVDVHFDPTKGRALLYFMIRYPGSNVNQSFSWTNVDKNSSVMKTLQLETEPGQTSLRFSLTEPHFLIKGPWRLPLDLE